jgi:5-methylcytosine-specific restriction enzyme subunit McrC
MFCLVLYQKLWQVVSQENGRGPRRERSANVVLLPAKLMSNLSSSLERFDTIRQIELIEYAPQTFAPESIPLAVGEKLWREYDERGGRIQVEFPSPRTGGRWRLTAQGWVGHIPLTADYHLYLHPKVSLSNLFRMWQYAYDLTGFHWLDGLADVASLAEFYDRLAVVLAERIIERARQGFYRAYIPHTRPLPAVRGRLQTPRRPQPAQVNLLCRYEELTADIPDNQLLRYTMGQIARSGRCREPAQTAVRHAYRALQGVAAERPFSPLDCTGRSYTRLNQDYRPLHALCRFFLEQSGPHQARGDHAMRPFLVDMARLYEGFVAAWLKAHLPPAFHLKAQERVNIDAAGSLHFTIDLVLYHRDHDTPVVVLDTKYKTAERPTTDDIAQIVAYAQAAGSENAILIYPTPPARPLAARVGRIYLRSLTFNLSDDLETAGYAFLAHLLATPSANDH